VIDKDLASAAKMLVSVSTIVSVKRKAMAEKAGMVATWGLSSRSTHPMLLRMALPVQHRPVAIPSSQLQARRVKRGNAEAFPATFSSSMDSSGCAQLILVFAPRGLISFEHYAMVDG
jgi:hypothetical protein